MLRKYFYTRLSGFNNTARVLFSRSLLYHEHFCNHGNSTDASNKVRNEIGFLVAKGAGSVARCFESSSRVTLLDDVLGFAIKM